MNNKSLLNEAGVLFRKHFGRPHTVAAFAPGRIEVLGNHTDYNEGFVLSAAINYGMYFLAAPSASADCRLVAGDLMEEVTFNVSSPAAVSHVRWSGYVIGMVAGLRDLQALPHGFEGLFMGNVPQGAGLSSSAALEMAAGLTLSRLYAIDVPPLTMAQIGQTAEHKFVGVRCGLLDQISSLFGQNERLVMTDFRSLEVNRVPLGSNACFLACNTNVKRALVEGEYNDRRRCCEEAARHFARILTHEVRALRDVSWEEWKTHSSEMDPIIARRAAHIIGENRRVLDGRRLLDQGRLEEFGQLMFESHKSSRIYFENSCAELDFIVDTAARLPGVLGARLSGGGFGGTVVIMLHPRDVETASQALRSAYQQEFRRTCDIRVIHTSDGARLIPAG